MGMTYKDIQNNLDEYINKHKKIIKGIKKYRYYSKNKVGVYYKNRIIKNLRLENRISNLISEDGTLTLGENNNSNLTILDVLVEDTLPKSAIETLKTFSVGEKPKIIVKEEIRKWIKEFELREEIHNKMKKIVHDCLVVGDSFFKVEDNGKKAEIILLKKENVLIIPDDWNSSRVGLYVYVEEREGFENKNYNYVEVFEPSGRVHVLNNTNKIYSKSNKNKINGDVDIGLGEFTIHHIKGIYEDESTLYSNSIYEGLTSTFVECTTRLTANSAVFNRHGNPKMTGSMDLTEKDSESGEMKVIEREYYQGEDETESNSMRYITPPTDYINITYPHLKIMVENAYRQLGVNEISLGLSKEGGLASGEAYKKAITPTLNKCRDIANNLYVPFIKMYKQAYKIETGKDLEIEIEFQDGISLSEKEIIENEKSLVEAKLISRTTILKNRGVENPEEELKKIAEEEKLLNPIYSEIDLDIPSGTNE